jgi:triacylglycerol lipase
MVLKSTGSSDARPLTPADAEALPTWRAAYSDRTAALMAEFSQLAYVPFVDEQAPPRPGAPKVEKSGGRKQLETCLAAGQFRLVDVFNRDDTQAFLAIRDDQFAVLAFRGTANLGDWAINLNVGRVLLPGFSNVRVHRGFLAAFDSSKEELVRAVNEYVPSSLGLYITGHSLGGALAQIASAVLERDNLAACYTFGSPRVGTQNFDRDVKCPHYRIVNRWDLVPGVPFPSPWGYEHTGDPRLLTAGPHPKEALRRDRGTIARTAVDLLALGLWPFSRKLLVIEDHMISNYRTKLESIAAARAVPAALR